MPVKIIIEDHNKWINQSKTFPGDEWKRVVSDVSGTVIISEDGTRKLENGQPRYLENGNQRNLE